MELIIKGRNGKLADDVKARIEKKVKSKILKYFDKVIKIEVEITVEKNPKINLNNIAEITVFTGREIIRAKDSAHDVYGAIDKATHKLERQIKKYRNKIIQRGRKPVEAKLEVEEDIDEIIKKQIVKIKSFTIKPSTPEDAVLQMDLLGHDFFVFINSESGKTSVVYRRKDKKY
ncbi:MAG: ribosome-associated translation inhibitor RaiA, partial [Actinobacteria bacterium]|nr:ribosome-associated translation inhibitor RaiA [Actinomycetota bacterium]